jgi:hypothetical protein
MISVENKSMKIFKNKIFQKALIIILSITVAISLAVRILFSLPLFYEQTPNQMVLTISIVFLVLLLFIFLGNKTLILRNLKKYLDWKNIIFIVVLFIIITATSWVSTIHYWSKPEKHQVEICFDAANETGRIKILKLVEPKTERLFSPKSFGFKYYPLIVKSGECIQGQMITLYWRFPLRFILKIINVVVQEEPPDGRLFISVNDVPAVVYFDKDSEEPIGTEILFTEGFDQGEVLPFARNKYISLGIKSIALIISSIYLSLFLFGLTEIIIKPPKGKRI